MYHLPLLMTILTIVTGKQKMCKKILRILKIVEVCNVYIKLHLRSFIFGQWNFDSLHNQELWQEILEFYDQYLLSRLHFSICSLYVYWASTRKLQEEAPIGLGLLVYSGAMTKLAEVYDQYLLCCLYFSICSLCIYWTLSKELQKGAPFLGNGILAIQELYK